MQGGCSCALCAPRRAATGRHSRVPPPPHRNNRYLMYGDVSFRVAEQLRRPDVAEFFARLIQRVAPKSHAQVAACLVAKATRAHAYMPARLHAPSSRACVPASCRAGHGGGGGDAQVLRELRRRPGEGGRALCTLRRSAAGRTPCTSTPHMRF